MTLAEAFCDNIADTGHFTLQTPIFGSIAFTRRKVKRTGSEFYFVYVLNALVRYLLSTPLKSTAVHKTLHLNLQHLIHWMQTLGKRFQLAGYECRYVPTWLPNWLRHIVGA